MNTVVVTTNRPKMKDRSSHRRRQFTVSNRRQGRRQFDREDADAARWDP